MAPPVGVLERQGRRAGTRHLGHHPAARRLAALALAAGAACALGQTSASTGTEEATASTDGARGQGGASAASAASGLGATGGGGTGGGVSGAPVVTTGGTASSGTGGTGGGTDTSPGGTTLPPATADNPYTFVGRTDLTTPGAPIFRFPNSAIGARFSGTQLGVRFAGDGDDRWEAQLDGGPPQVLVTHPSATPVLIPIATNLAAGDHTLWLTKRTERIQSGGGENCGQTQFYGLDLGTGGVLKTPPVRRTRRILALGDSSFTGYGAGQLVTSSKDDCGFSPATQNAQASVPAYLAAAFGAELHNISYSGVGVYLSFWDPTLTHAMPYVWRELAPHAPTPLWDHTLFVPDVVVVSGGGDDLSGDPGVGTFPNRPAFVAAYRDFLKAIRQTAPGALIVATVPPGAYGSDLPNLSAAIKEAVAAANDPNTLYFWYFDCDPTYSTYGDAAVGLQLFWGCRMHVSAKGAAFLAGRLAAFISPRRGWSL